MFPIYPFAERAKPPKLQEINPTFDAQNAPQKDYYKSFVWFIQYTKILFF